jgi:DNA-binding response OmpR family regulator
MTETDDSVTVLVVDDESAVADAYALRLRQKYDVSTAYGGEEALEVIDADVDVVLLDRRMPMSGDEVLERIRERGLDSRVIMVTAVTDPDFDIIEMPFDDYLCKPVDKEDLFAAIEQQLETATYDDRVDEYFSISSKIGVLEAEKTPEQLAESEEYQRLTERAETLRDELDDQVDAFDDMANAFETIERGSG